MTQQDAQASEPERGELEESIGREQRSKPWKAYLEAELGFRNHWYPAFFGAELKAGVGDDRQGILAAVRSETICGEQILFRRVGDQVFAIQDRCVHRGVKLSARPECFTAETVTCWLHGFTYDVRTGEVVTILTDPESPLIGKLRARSYPVAERAGIVWVYIGDGDPPPLAWDVQPGLFDDDLAVYPHGFSGVVKSNWRLGVENGWDGTHLYLHRHSKLLATIRRPIPLGEPPSREGFQWQEDAAGPKGIYLARRRGMGRPFWESNIGAVTISAPLKPTDPDTLSAPMIISVWLPAGLKVDPFPTPDIIHFEWYVPIDERSHKYIITWGRRVMDETQRQQFFGEADEIWSDLVPHGFNHDDVFAREAMEPFYAGDGWQKEHLMGADIMLTQWRKLATRHHRGIQRRGLV
jgi:carbazole 1,9a-dioxygenase terminal dioxygenase component